MFIQSRLFKLFVFIALIGSMVLLSASIIVAKKTSASSLNSNTRTKATAKEFSHITLTNAQSATQASTTSAAVYVSPIINPQQVFNAVGANLFGAGATPETIQIEIKVREQTGWTAWQVLEFSDDWKNNQPEGLGHKKGAFTELLFVKDAQEAQYRVSFLGNQQQVGQAEINKIKLVFINSTQGPTLNKQAGMFNSVASWVSSMIARAADAADVNAANIDETHKPPIISREAWGADPALMTWSPEYKAPASKLILHHTAGTQGGADPAVVVRGIYYYHAVVREWGDIGYNYIVDENGNVFGGR